MKVGILSDTHGSALAWEKACKIFAGCELIVHTGDVLYHGPRNPLPDGHNPQKLAELINNSTLPVIFTRGNCDAEIDSVLIKYPIQSPYAVVYVNGKTAIAAHGTDMDDTVIAKKAALYKADIFISGHTHIPRLERMESIVFVNPGSCALPKGNEGPTAAVWDDTGIKVMSINEGKVIKEIKF